MVAQMLFKIAGAMPRDGPGQYTYRFPAGQANQYFVEESAKAYAMARPYRPHPEVVIITRPP